MKLSIFFILTLIGFKSFSQEQDLPYYIEKAQKNSPLLTDYNNQIQSVALDSLLNRATIKPQINGTAFGNYAPVIQDFGYDTTLSNSQTLSGLVSINQKIIGKKNRDNQLQNFKWNKEGLKINKKIALKDLNKAIISQYISTYTSWEQIQYNQKIAALLKEEATILKKMTQNSVYKQTDYLIFSASVKQQDLVILQLQQQYKNDLGFLNYLAGEIDTTLVRLQKPNITLKNSIERNQNVFFKPYKLDSLKLQNQNKQIDFAYKPSFSLLSDLGYMSTFTYLPHKNFGFSFGFGLTVPIYDGNQRDLLHQKNSVALETNLAYKNNFNRQYHQQLLLLNQKLKQTDQIDRQLQSQLKIAEALIEANKKLLVTGDAQITEFVIAIGSIITIQNNIAQNSINKLQIINEINYWNTND